jgi:hypothetical protein
MSTYAFTIGALPDEDIEAWLVRVQATMPSQLDRLAETGSVLRLAATVLGNRSRITIYKDFSRVRIDGASAATIATQLGLASVAQIERTLPGGTQPTAAAAPAGRVAQPSATLHTNLTASDAGDIAGWLDRARADLEAQGAEVQLNESASESSVLGATLELGGAPLQIGVAVDKGADTARIFLYRGVPSSRAAACLSWIADLLELTPTGPPEVHAPTMKVQVVTGRRGSIGRTKETFISASSWDASDVDGLSPLGDLFT